MQRHLLTRRLRPTLAVLGAVAAFTACSGDEPNPLGGNTAADLAVAVEVSSPDAKPGAQIAVAASVDAQGRELGGIQGFLRYDPRRLEFVGQAPEGAMLSLVNASRASQGELRAISFVPGSALGPRAGSMVFRVKAPDYLTGISYQPELATDRGGNTELRRFRILATRVAADLVVPAGARPMAMEDWTQALYPDLVAAEARVKPSVAGQYLANLRYGNANLSAENPASCTSVNILDAAYVGNIAVGNNSVLAVDFPTRDPVIAGNVRPASSPIPGVAANGSRGIDILDAAAIGNEAVGNNQTIVCDLIPGREPVPTTIVTLAGSQATSRLLTRDTLYRIDGIYRVTGGATLTIQAGTRLEGRFTSTSGTPSALYIERDGRIDAQGTPLQPIVFTCDQTPKFRACWGGVVLAGNASINGGQGAAANTSATSPVIAGRAATGGCLEQDYEGSIGLALIRFGGCNDDDNSGIIRYARFEYGGFLFQVDKELNNLTVGGVGRGTTLEFLQMHGGSDDGFEIFGGTMNTRNIVITGSSDDGFDYSQGWSGKAQFIIVQSDSLNGDKGFEIDNAEPPQSLDLLPRVDAQVYNVTLVGAEAPASASGVAGNNVNDAIHLRRGARPDHFNFVMIGWPRLLDLDDDASTCPAGVDLTTQVKWQSVTAFNFTTIDNTDVEATCQPYPAATSIEDNYFNDATAGNVVAASIPLIAPYNNITPDWRPVSAAAVSQGSSTVPPNDGFFDATANYRGAVAPGVSIPWYSGWIVPFQSATAP